jgi:hypothetical protein
MSDLINNETKNRNSFDSNDSQTYSNPRFQHRSQSFVGNSLPKENTNLSNISSPSPSSVQTKDEFVNREEMKIKDLIVKIQILKNGVIEERNKNAESEKEIQKFKQSLKEYENVINEKENMIINLTKEKFELQSKMQIEKQKNETSPNENTNNSNQNGNYYFTDFINGIFQRRDSMTNTSDVDTKRMHNDITDLQVENEILRNKIEEQGMVFERCKIEYQNLIKIQAEKIKTLEKTLNDKNKIIDENNKKLEIMFENYKKFDVEKTRYESEINELNKSKSQRDEKIAELLLNLEDNSKIIASYKESLSRHEIESASLARKLAELKNAIIESNIVIQTFKCEKVGSFYNSRLELTFGRTESNDYVMKLKDEDEGKEEYVDVEDIEYLKLNEKFLDILDVCFLVRNFILIY